MPIALTRFNVALGAEDDYTEHTVVITGADKMRAELEAKRNGLVELQSIPMHITFLWCWASLTRRKVIDMAWQEFAATVLDIDPLDDEEVDPTRPATDTGSA